MTKWQANIAAVFLILTMVLAALLFPGMAGWIVVSVCMVAFLVVLGVLICKRPLGILVNERNLMSLPRFQMVIWTVIVLSAYFVIAMARVASGVPDPLSIKMDWQLWALMGISATSLVGAPLINSTKKQKDASGQETEKAAEALVKTGNIPDSLAAGKKDAAAVETSMKKTNQGMLYANPTVGDASFADMFEGDEVGNTAYMDLSKVQMFYFTIIIAIAYIATLAPLIAKLKTDATSIIEFPALHEGIIALLGISHAGFLATKGVNHTKK